MIEESQRIPFTILPIKGIDYDGSPKLTQAAKKALIRSGYENILMIACPSREIMDEVNNYFQEDYDFLRRLSRKIREKLGSEFINQMIANSRKGSKIV